MWADVQEPWQLFHDQFKDLSVEQLTVAVLRLSVAAVLGGVLGYQRQKAGKAAGLRTHMLVCVGAAFFVLAPQLDGMETADLSRVIQGVITGIGFIGGGTILKLTDTGRVQGLTTAAGIWLTAALGVGAGLGRLGTTLVGAGLAFLILGFLYRFEKLIGEDNEEARSP